MNDEEFQRELELRKEQLIIEIADRESKLWMVDELLRWLEGKKDPEKPAPESAKLREVILFAIKHAPIKFSLNDIESIIKNQFPDTQFQKSSIASLFWKMMKEDDNHFKVIKEGAGRTPTVYTKGSHVFENEP